MLGDQVMAPPVYPCSHDPGVGPADMDPAGAPNTPAVPPICNQRCEMAFDASRVNRAGAPLSAAMAGEISNAQNITAMGSTKRARR